MSDPLPPQTQADPWFHGTPGAQPGGGCAAAMKNILNPDQLAAANSGKPFFVLASAGFNWGIPGVLVILGQLLCSAILAAMILTLMKKG